MIIVINRTDSYESVPFTEAFKKVIPVSHIRTCTEEHFNFNYSKFEGSWKSKGYDHTIVEGKNWIKRTEDHEHWVIEINSLEELKKLFEKYPHISLEYVDNEFKIYYE